MSRSALGSGRAKAKSKSTSPAAVKVKIDSLLAAQPAVSDKSRTSTLAHGPSVRRVWSAADYALAALIDFLRANTLAIGERLPNLKDLSAVMGLSHVVVRDALEVLAAEGILDIRPGRNGGIYVTGVRGFPHCLTHIYEDTDAAFTRQLIEARRVLERETALSAIGADEAEIVVLDALLAQMAGAVRDSDVFIELSVRFFLRIALINGNPMLTEYLRDVLNRLAVVGVRMPRTQLTEGDLGIGLVIFANLIDGIRRQSAADVVAAVDRHIEVLSGIDNRA